MTAESTTVLIVGAGPVGLSTALFLARQGVTPIVVERRSSISQIPRATGLHARTIEIFRAVGLEDAFRKVGLKFVNAGMEPEEVAAGRATPLVMLGAPSLAQLDGAPVLEEHHVPYDDFTPCWPLWCGQDHYEPILLDEAVSYGARVRFDTELVSIEQDTAGVSALVVRRDTGERTTIRADYLVGADGVRSTVRESAGIGHHSHGIAAHFVSIIFRAKIDVIKGKQPFTFVSLVNPDAPGIFLFIERDRWMFGANYFPERGQSPADFTPEHAIELVRIATGTPDLEVELESLTPWDAKHMIADRYRSGRVFLAGDACHAHPPAGGFGVNAGIQDAHNLAWKLAAVVNGWAGDHLLASYEAERRPIGAETAAQAWMLFRSRGGPIPAAERPLMRDFIIVAMGYRYASGAVLGGEPGPAELPTTLSYPAVPGSRAPHGRLSRDGEQISSLDLFGESFVLVTGPDGAAWAEAAGKVAERFDGPLRAYSFAGGLADPDRWWSRACGMPAGGALLVRPDGFVAWRSAADEPADDEVLDSVLSTVLGRR